jgi:hypothetical protein
MICTPLQLAERAGADWQRCFAAEDALERSYVRAFQRISAADLPDNEKVDRVRRMAGLMQDVAKQMEAIAV